MFFLSFIFLNLIFIEAKCPASSTKGVNNNKCYYFFGGATDFTTAERNCVELGGHLASICNAWDNNLLQSVSVGKLQEYGAKDFWIGWNDLSNKGVWQWINPNSSCNNNYTNWNSGQPSGNDCTSMLISGGKWQSSDCTISRSFVCEVFEEIYNAQPKCRDGYTYFSEWNSCYKFVIQLMTYNDSEQNCVNEGGQLVSIHSNTEEEFIDGLIQEQIDYSYFWIGFYSTNVIRPNITSYWRWKDQSSVIYTDWFAQLPNNDSPCAGMATSDNPWENGRKFWDNDHPCVTTWPSVCKQPPIWS